MKDMELTLRLNADGKAMITGVKKAEDALEDLGSAADDAAGKIDNTASKTKQFSSAAKSIRKMTLGFAGIAAALGAGPLINAQRQFDVLNAQLVTATGSVDEAKKTFESLTQFAAQTPYALGQSVQGFAQLKNLGLDPTIESMKSFGNFAAAMGKDLNQMIEAVADATTMEFERLKEFGIIARQETDVVKFTFQGVTTSIGKNAEDIKAYLLSIGNTKFADAMNNRVKTLDGAINNLGDSFDLLKLKIVQGGIGDAVEKIVRGMSAGIEFLTEHISVIARGFATATVSAAAFYATQKRGLIISLGTSILTTGRNLLTFAGWARTARAAVLGLNIAMKANPLGLFATAVAGVVTAITLFSSKTNTAEDSVIDFAYALDEAGDALTDNELANKLNRDATDIQRKATEAARLKSIDLANQLKAETNQLYENSKAAVHNAAVKAREAYKELELARRVRDNSAWSSNFFGGAASAKTMENLYGDRVKQLKAAYEEATSSLNRLNDEQRNANKLVAEAGQLAKSVSQDSGPSQFLTLKETQKWAQAAAEQLKELEWQYGRNNATLVDYDRIKTQVFSDAKSLGAVEMLNQALGETEKKGKGAGRGARGAGRGIKDMSREAEKAAKKLEQMKKAANDAAKGLFSSLFPSKKLLMDMQADARILGNVIGGNAKEAMAAYGVSVAEVAKKQAVLNKTIKDFKDGVITKEQAKKAFDDMKKGIEDVKASGQETSNVLETQFKRAVESIDQSFADMWKSLLNGGKVSFKSLADSLKNIFAETLHGLTTKRLTGWVTGLFSSGETMNSVTGEIRRDARVSDVVESLNDGFKWLGGKFTKGLEKLGVDKATAAKYTGWAGTAMAGLGIGAMMGSMFDGNIGLSAVAGVAGAALGSAISTEITASMASAGAGAYGAAATSIGTAAASYAVPVIGAIFAGLVAYSTRKKIPATSTTRSKDGDIHHTQYNRQMGSSRASDDQTDYFWDLVNTQAEKYGVDIAGALASQILVKAGKGGVSVDYELFDTTGAMKSLNDYRVADTYDDKGMRLINNSAFLLKQRMEKDFVSLFKTSLSADDLKDPKKVALELGKLQVEALKTADWTNVAVSVGKGLSLVDTKSLDSRSLNSLWAWVDRMVEMGGFYGTAMSTMTNNFEHFKGSFEQFKAYTHSLYDIVARYGKNAVDEVVMYAAANPMLDATEIAKGFNAATYGMEMLKQKAVSLIRLSPGLINKSFVDMTSKIVKAMGGSDKALKIYTDIFNAVATDTHKAGIAYQATRSELDKYNQLMGLSGDRYISTTEQLRAYVAELDPLSNSYATAMSRSASLANVLVAVSHSAKYFTDAITNVSNTLDGVIKSIREDLMDNKTLYDFRKEQAESLVKSIAEMNDVSAIKSATETVSRLVNDMWRSLGDGAKNALNGNWMIDFLEETKTLAKGRIQEIKNQYGDNKVVAGYSEVKAVAEGEKVTNVEAVNHLITQQKATGDKQIRASEKMDKAASSIESAVQTLTLAANKIASGAAEFAKGYSVDVTVHSASDASEMT